jgi:hypothetical protein
MTHHIGRGPAPSMTTKGLFFLDTYRQGAGKFNSIYRNLQCSKGAGSGENAQGDAYLETL